MRTYVVEYSYAQLVVKKCKCVMLWSVVTLTMKLFMFY